MFDKPDNSDAEEGTATNNSENRECNDYNAMVEVLSYASGR